MSSNATNRCATLGEEEIGVWSVRLVASQETLVLCQAVLGEDEVARAERIHSSEQRSEFVIAHGVLRLLLGRHLDTAPEGIRFRYGIRFKPSLALPSSTLSFNMAHSGGFAVYALASATDVGIDMERVRAESDLMDVAARFFSINEVSRLSQLPDRERLLGFYRCWTRKEAYLKAVGDGLHSRLDSFEVSFESGEAPRLLSLNEGSRAPAEWCLHDLSLMPGFVGALAYPGARRKVELHMFEDADAVVNELGCRESSWPSSAEPSRPLNGSESL